MWVNWGEYSFINNMCKDNLNTPEQIQEEIEKCKDFVYFYNKYAIVNGKKPKPITHEEYNNLMNYSTLKLRKNYKDVFNWEEYYKNLPHFLKIIKNNDKN